LDSFELVENMLEMITREFDFVVKGSKFNQSSFVGTFSPLTVETDP
jgi:hypothetical protein